MPQSVSLLVRQATPLRHLEGDEIRLQENAKRPDDLLDVPPTVLAERLQEPQSPLRQPTFGAETFNDS
jgi:hypothetical protein